MKLSLKTVIIFLTLSLIICGVLGAQSKPNTLSPRELSEGWILLFDGETNFGWENHGMRIGGLPKHHFCFLRGQRLAWNHFSVQQFRIEGRLQDRVDGNSGIFLRADSKGEPANTGYELQICDTHKEFVTGSLVNYHKALRK